MMEGEFNAMTELYKTVPSLVPQPHAWGKFKIQQPSTYFFLCDFIDMRNQLPDPARLCSRIAELHRVSVSPTGKFGFHISTYHGKYPQSVQWNDNWASFFKNLLQDALRADLEANGPWPEFEKVSERTLNKVIPRLLGVLQENGRIIKPSLIHGDLWDGNIGTAYADNSILIFDSGAYYAHNEMEIGMWRCVRHHISAKIFTRQYFREFPVSEPVEEWDDRNRIYCVKMNIVHSAHHKGDIVRQTAYEDMCYLVNKYAPWEAD
ncbi:MAG: hypothetical protein LQ351_004564 [Letrouitia transgressa]|nr:MAG: hypothetical protein LQ351_004564 [Letrouitia transgressa]